MNRPRVLILLGAIPLYGLELSVIEVGRMLRDAGCEVLFVVNGEYSHQAIGPRLDGLGLPYRGMRFFGAVERRLSPIRLWRMIRMQFTEGRKLREILREFRPTHLHVGHVWDYVNAWWGLRGWRGAMIVHQGTAADARHPAMRALWRHVWRRASRVVVVSRFLARHYASWGLDNDKIEVIYNIVPTRPSTTRATTPVPPRGEALRAIYVGHVTDYKGVDDLIDAVIALRARGVAIEVVILGDTSAAWATALRERVSQGRDPEAARFVGYVDDPAPWFAVSDVHVAPSKCREAFGMVVLEAKTAGLPSIVFDDGALPELVADGVEGQVCAQATSAALEAALSRYADDRALARAQGEAARASLKRLGIDDVPWRWARVYGVPA